MASPTVWDEDSQCYVYSATIAAPSGGGTIDANARTALTSILGVLSNARIMAKDTNATPVPFAWGPTVWDDTYHCFVFSAFISTAAGGATQDAETRTAIAAIASAMSSARLIGYNAATTLPLPPTMTSIGSGTNATHTLPPGTYYYSVTTVDTAGLESLPSQTLSETVTDEGGSWISLGWDAVDGAATYSVFRGDTAVVEDMLTLATAQAGTTYTDDGTGTPASPAPPAVGLNYTWDEDVHGYVHAGTIAAPAGGGTADAESRTAIGSILTALKAAGVIGLD